MQDHKIKYLALYTSISSLILNCDESSLQEPTFPSFSIKQQCLYIEKHKLLIKIFFYENKCDQRTHRIFLF